MSIKKVLKYLPFGSYFALCAEKREFLSPMKAMGHIFYATTPLLFVAVSSILGTPNVLRWNEVIKEAQREHMEYHQLYQKAVKCVEKDGVNGLNLNELAKLYSEAGVNLRVNPDSDPGLVTFRLPRLTRKDLEKVVKTCEVPAK